MDDWYWGQTFQDWKLTGTPTQPGATPGTTVAKLAGGGPFATAEEARKDAAANGFVSASIAVWSEPVSNRV